MDSDAVQSLHTSVCPHLESITIFASQPVSEEVLVAIAQMAAPQLTRITVRTSVCRLVSSADINPDGLSTHAMPPKRISVTAPPRLPRKRVEYETNGVTVTLEVEKDAANHRCVMHVTKKGKPLTYTQNAGGDVHATGVYGSLKFPLVFSSSDRVSDVIDYVAIVGVAGTFHRRCWRYTACRLMPTV